jgi:hypothetical protein
MQGSDAVAKKTDYVSRNGASGLRRHGHRAKRKTLRAPQVKSASAQQ